MRIIDMQGLREESSNEKKRRRRHQLKQLINEVGRDEKEEKVMASKEWQSR